MNPRRYRRRLASGSAVALPLHSGDLRTPALAAVATLAGTLANFHPRPAKMSALSGRGARRDRQSEQYFDGIVAMVRELQAIDKEEHEEDHGYVGSLHGIIGGMLDSARRFVAAKDRP